MPRKRDRAPLPLVPDRSPDAGASADPGDIDPERDPKTLEAAERHRTRPDPPVHGQQTSRQFLDTDGEGGVGGSLDGLYVKRPTEHRTDGTSSESPQRDPGDVLEMEYRRAHGEQGDASDDFTSERAQEAQESEHGDSEVTESMTSSGVMEENLDVGAEADGTGPPVGGPPDMRAPRRSAAANRKDPRKPPDSAVQG